MTEKFRWWCPSAEPGFQMATKRSW